MSGELVFAAPEWMLVATALLSGGAFLSRHRRRSVSILVLPLLAIVFYIAGTRPATILLILATLFATLVWVRRIYAPMIDSLTPSRAFMLRALRFVACYACILIASQPSCVRSAVDLERPIFAVVLDDSESMAVEDDHSVGSRAHRVERAVGAASAALDTLSRRYDVRTLHVRRAIDVDLHPDWSITPNASYTQLADGLRRARSLRSTSGRLPAGVMLISDGGDNASPPRGVTTAASELAHDGIPLLAIAVGPSDQSRREVQLDPAAVPGRIGLRERLTVPITGRASGLRNQNLSIEVTFGGRREQRAIPIRQDTQLISESIDIVPPGVGVYRLDVTLGDRGGPAGDWATTSAMIEVVADRVRVLMPERGPRPEVGFVTRTLSGDPNLEVDVRFLRRGETVTGDAPGRRPISDYDVILLGAVDPMRDDLRTLDRAVVERGVGVLFASGVESMRTWARAAEPLASISALDSIDELPAQSGGVPISVPPAGANHAILRGVLIGPDAKIPPLPARGAFGGLRNPALTVVMESPQHQPIFVVGQIGAGRVALATWDATWPWALQSDSSAESYRKFWRQLVGWLANRKPLAWVVTDAPRYIAERLNSGREKIRIRAGVAGDVERRDELIPRLLMLATVPDARPIDIPLRRGGDEWIAELPEPTVAIDPAAETFSLEFSLRRRGSDSSATTDQSRNSAGEMVEYIARGGFVIDPRNLENTTPNANLELMRAIATGSAAPGGYWTIESLPKALADVAARDVRVQVERVERLVLVEDRPWPLFTIVLTALALEWAIRRRSNLR